MQPRDDINQQFWKLIRTTNTALDLTPDDHRRTELIEYLKKIDINSTLDDDGYTALQLTDKNADVLGILLKYGQPNLRIILEALKEIEEEQREVRTLNFGKGGEGPVPKSNDPRLGMYSSLVYQYKLHFKEIHEKTLTILNNLLKDTTVIPKISLGSRISHLFREDKTIAVADTLEKKIKETIEKIKTLDFYNEPVSNEFTKLYRKLGDLKHFLETNKDPHYQLAFQKLDESESSQRHIKVINS